MQWAISEYLCFSPRLPLLDKGVFSGNLSLGQSQVGLSITIISFLHDVYPGFRQVSKRVCTR